jgi:acetoin utilization deacetylase AcuC-like enzyme
MPDNMGNGEYLALLRGRLPQVFDSFKPDFVFYLAGVDTAAGDSVGRSKLSPAGLLERDLFVVDQTRSRNLPLCILLDGGWEKWSWRLHYRSIRAILARHGGVPFRVPVSEN